MHEIILGDRKVERPQSTWITPYKELKDAVKLLDLLVGFQNNIRKRSANNRVD